MHRTLSETLQAADMAFKYLSPLRRNFCNVFVHTVMQYMHIIFTNMDAYNNYIVTSICNYLLYFA